MGRWRAPREHSSPYITPEGFDTLQREHESLWKRRVDVTAALSAAAAEGDRSENAEYIYRKKELGGIDSRIRYLQKRLQELNIVSEVSDTQRVYFGARVVLEADDGTELSIRIVGADELDLENNHISIDSPLGRALLNKACDDEISYEVQGQNISYVITRINY